MSGIAFPGAPYEHSFFVADTEATGPMVPERAERLLVAQRVPPVLPDEGDQSLASDRHPAERPCGKDNVTFEDLIPALCTRAGAGLSFTSCHWFSTYRIHHRCTERFRDRRCFLLGDAAHVHSPMGGQGMNTGLQDAYNLAWKLALVISNRADDALLDTYEAERRPFAQQLLATTDRAFRVVVSENWLCRAASHSHHSPRCGRRDVAQTGAESGVPDALPDWDSLPREPPLAEPRDTGRERPARWRSFSLASSEVSAARVTQRICFRDSTTRVSTCS